MAGSIDGGKTTGRAAREIYICGARNETVRRAAADTD